MKKRYRCIGCGNVYKFDSEMIAFTCPCGCRLFYNSDEHISYIPVSLFFAMYGKIKENKELPHIDYYLGKSGFMDREKKEVIEFFKEKGAIWSWECPKCKERFIERTRFELRHKLYPFELHPELEKLVK